MKLVAFAILSPVINERCSYIIGKSLCSHYPGLSEYADYIAYKKAQLLNAIEVNKLDKIIAMLEEMKKN